MEARTDAGLVASGIALILGAALLLFLRAPVAVTAFAFAVGVGAVASAHTFVRSVRTRLIVMLVVFAAFTGYRLGVLVTRGVTTTRALALALDVLMLALVLGLGYVHAHGLAQLAAVLRVRRGGYAPVLDEAAAASAVEAELARSRRHGSPLTFLLLETPVAPRVDAFGDAVSRVSTSALADLERAYARDRTCQLIAEHVRRSDVVVCAEHRFVVISTDTSPDGTAMLARRMVEAAQRDLGLVLETGIAGFPTHGSTYAELVAVAGAAVGDGNGDGHGAGAASSDAQYEPAPLPPAQASS
jgi:hypothetical protein